MVTEITTDLLPKPYFKTSQTMALAAFCHQLLKVIKNSSNHGNHSETIAKLFNIRAESLMGKFGKLGKRKPRCSTSNGASQNPTIRNGLIQHAD